ncbi:MAG: DpnII family type II restriction endonuclease [Gemmatimonadales bacterium]
MKVVRQELDAIAASLTEMHAEWMDDTAAAIIAAIAEVPTKSSYAREDLDGLLSKDFQTALSVFRLFLDISKDEFETRLPVALGGGTAGIKRYRADRDGFLDAIERLGVPQAMAELASRPVRWSDLLVERLKGGRGRAVRGQARGRSLEDFVETIVNRVFGAGGYDSRCSFVGKDGKALAKADFAVPSRLHPRIVVESKGYAATGSKQTDVLGDLRSIVDTKRTDTTLLFVTDGLTWRRRLNDLRKIVAMQNAGEIARIYTRAMVEDMESDLRTLKQEHGL